MPIINISVKNKIANAECGATIVCKNSDYVARFDFDSQWDDYVVKTAKFAFNGTFIPVVFMGSECAVPKLPNTYLCGIEVEAGNIKTAVPAWVDCLPVLDDNYGEIDPPSPSVYEQIMQMIKDGVLTGAKIVDTIYIGVDEKGGNVYKQIFDNGTENYFTAPKGLDADVVIGEEVGTAYDGAKGAQNAQDIQALLSEIIKIYEKIRKNAENISENSEDTKNALAKKLDKSNRIANGNLVSYNSITQEIEDSGISKKNVDDNSTAIENFDKRITQNSIGITTAKNDIKKVEARIESDHAQIEQNTVDIENLTTDLAEEVERAKKAEKVNSDAIEILTEGISPTEIDSVKDLINYTKEHGAEVLQMQNDIASNAEAIENHKTAYNEKVAAIDSLNANQQNYIDYLNGVESEGLNIQIDLENSSATVVDAGEFRGENLVIPSHYQGFPVTTIGEQAFYYESVYAPKRIKIPDTVTSILGGAFQENSAIEEVVMPRNLKHIEGGAFEYFYGKSLIIPKSVETIGGYVFTSSDVTLYIEAESKPDGWMDAWDEMHIGEVVWGYIPDFESVTEKIGDISTALDELHAYAQNLIGGN